VDLFHLSLKILPYRNESCFRSAEKQRLLTKIGQSFNNTALKRKLDILSCNNRWAISYQYDLYRMPLPYHVQMILAAHLECNEASFPTEEGRAE
jgi:hypothetical protein